ncbi:MAG: (d)CMP kinase [Clostridia bacterium]|nr:(d)CMP kinase [Clostridia bacterium]
MIKIAIDGPSGAGKSTVSKALAKKLGYIYVDTGAMYRAAALGCITAEIDIKNNPERAAEMVSYMNIDIKYGDDGSQLIFLDRENVTDFIRTPEVSIGASDISKIPDVRLKLVDIQRKLGEQSNVIMDGRDIGTYVFPDADVKIFLTATDEERARRRHKELLEKGQTVTFEEVLEDMRYRDKNDSTRAFAPLKPAEDSVLVETDGLSFEESVEKVQSIILERLGQNAL